MKKSITLALAIGLVAITASAQNNDQQPSRGNRHTPRDRSQGRAPGGPDGQGRPIPPLAAALDANNDGVIDASEIANASAALRTLDKNGDGVLTADELHPHRPGGDSDGGQNRRDGEQRRGRPDGGQGGSQGEHKPPTPPLIAALDANHDGMIDANEIVNASTALLTLDKNGDGKLTMDEICPQRPPHQKGPPSGQ